MFNRLVLAVFGLAASCGSQADFSACKGDVMDVSHLHYLLNFHGEELRDKTDNDADPVRELWVNDVTGAWTVILIIGDLACITEFGTDPNEAPEMK